MNEALGESPPNKNSFETALSPDEQIASSVCGEMLETVSGYQGTYSFGTPGGNDLDLRLCFTDLDSVAQEDIRARVLGRLHAEGVGVDVDLLFMSSEEFINGIRDLVELGDVTERLRDGFDPHQRQAAVGDTSMFSLYIFSTMRTLHRSHTASTSDSPDTALNNLTLTRNGAIGWMHFYVGCFLHEYLRGFDSEDRLAVYKERLAKFTARVILGNVLARLEPESLLDDDLKWSLIDAIRRANAQSTTDAEMINVLLESPYTQALLGNESQHILRIASEVRNGDMEAMPTNLIPNLEAEVFYSAFEQGSDRRQERGEDADTLTSYALGELVCDLGHVVSYAQRASMVRQNTPGNDVMYIPLKLQDGRDNAGVNIRVVDHTGNIVAEALRTPGRVVGEGAIFGLQRSATVTAAGHVEVYTIAVERIRTLLADPSVFDELQQSLLETREARRVDTLLRYLAREAILFTRGTLPYTTTALTEVTQEILGSNPLATYHLGQQFQATLACLATSDEYPDVAEIGTDKKDLPIFEAGQLNDRLYAVTEGAVQIVLQNDEALRMHPGDYFGESSLLGMPTTGSATLMAGSVVAVNSQWFKRFTQSRQLIRGADLPDDLRNVRPVHLLYHLAAEGYDRVRRRLLTLGR